MALHLRTRPVTNDMLRTRLDALVDTFDLSTIEPDPLQVLLRYSDPHDQEIAGLIAAAFAYGRADIVVEHAGSVLSRMTPSPYSYLLGFEAEEGEERLSEGRGRKGEVE